LGTKGQLTSRFKDTSGTELGKRRTNRQYFLVFIQNGRSILQTNKDNIIKQCTMIPVIKCSKKTSSTPTLYLKLSRFYQDIDNRCFYSNNQFFIISITTFLYNMCIRECAAISW